MLPSAFHSRRRAVLALFLASIAPGVEAEIRTEADASFPGLHASFSERFCARGEADRPVVGLAPELRWAAMGAEPIAATPGIGSCDGFCVASDSFRAGAPRVWSTAVAARLQRNAGIAFDAGCGTARTGDERLALPASEHPIVNPR